MSRLIFVALALSVTCSVNAQSSSGLVDISAVRTGWNSDAFGIITVQPISNPANCPVADGYVSTSAHPGYQTFLSTSLTAFALSTQVTITIHNTLCDEGGHPLLIGINLNH